MTTREETKALRKEIAALREQLAGLEEVVGHAVGPAQHHHHHHYAPLTKPAPSPFQPFPTPMPFSGNTYFSASAAPTGTISTGSMSVGEAAQAVATFVQRRQAMN